MSATPLTDHQRRVLRDLVTFGETEGSAICADAAFTVRPVLQQLRRAGLIECAQPFRRIGAYRRTPGFWRATEAGREAVEAKAVAR